VSSRGIDKIKDLYNRYLAAKIGESVSVGWLRRLIAVEIGSDSRTVDAYMRLLAEFKYIKPGKVDKIVILDVPGN
jgi:hypothetical protein